MLCCWCAGIESISKEVTEIRNEAQHEMVLSEESEHDKVVAYLQQLKEAVDRLTVGGAGWFRISSGMEPRIFIAGALGGGQGSRYGTAVGTVAGPLKVLQGADTRYRNGCRREGVVNKDSDAILPALDPAPADRVGADQQVPAAVQGERERAILQDPRNRDALKPASSSGHGPRPHNRYAPRLATSKDAKGP